MPARNQELTGLLKEVQERTSELQKAVSARDEFISVASHELKTPLSALKLQAQITQRELAKGVWKRSAEEVLKEFAAQIDSQVDRLQKLVEDMLDVSRIQRGTIRLNPETLNLGRLVADVVDRFTPETLNSGSTIALDAPDDVEGSWDRYRIEQIVLNLLSNAIKYGAGRAVFVRVERCGPDACICVRDHGIGISRADQARIFERFERAISANEASGLGLGLYISREILTAHKGSISVRSEPGKGSEFIARLPLRPAVDVEEGRKDYEF